MSRQRLHINDSGWRAVTADGFTVARLSAVVSALGDLFPRQRALLGFDNRFLSEEFGHHAASLLRERGWAVDLIPRIFPTPGVAKLVREDGYDWGLVITASHNPYYYNGLKILDSFGALISREPADRIEKRTNEILENGSSPAFPFEVGRRVPGAADAEALRRRYLETIFARVNVEKIRDAGLRVSWDAFAGTVAPLFPILLERLGVAHEGVALTEEPTYGRRRLEPDEASLTALGELTARTSSVVGLATDVDGDRFSAVDGTGAYIQNNPLGSLMVWYLLAVRGERGTIYQTVSCSTMTERICREFGVPLKVEPVGFMQMGRHMVEDKAPLIGIEETGGMAYGPHLPFKDGLMAHALVLEMLATQGKTVPTLIEDLRKKYGRFHYRRIDLKLPSQEEADRWMDAALWERAVGEAVRETSRLDGLKWFFPSGWILIRRSKTEPLLRIYFESEEESFLERVAKTIEGAKR